MVRGITVRSRRLAGTIGAALQTLRGGNISLWSELCETAREEAFEIMVQHAAALQGERKSPSGLVSTARRPFGTPLFQGQGDGAWSIVGDFS